MLTMQFDIAWRLPTSCHMSPILHLEDVQAINQEHFNGGQEVSCTTCIPDKAQTTTDDATAGVPQVQNEMDPHPRHAVWHE